MRAGPSLSARRSWIEIYLRRTPQQAELVALRKESVDRNREIVVPAPAIMVALRKESVDRNIFINYTIDNKSRVALRKESVDRNSNRAAHI